MMTIQNKKTKKKTKKEKQNKLTDSGERADEVLAQVVDDVFDGFNQILDTVASSEPHDNDGDGYASN